MEEPTLDEMKKYCSEYIRKHFGDQYDTTKWWDKLTAFYYYKDFKKKEIEDGQVRYFRQNE